jgi:hypothetical protein
VPDFGGLRGAPDRESVLEVLGDRLLAIDVLAGGDRAPQQPCAQLGRGGVEEDLVVRIVERGIEIEREPIEPVRLGQRLELGRVAADQKRFRDYPGAVGECDPAFRPERQDRADQVLVHAHPPGHAVHDDADPPLNHPPLLFLEPGLNGGADRSRDHRLRVPPRRPSRWRHALTSMPSRHGVCQSPDRRLRGSPWPR